MNGFTIRGSNSVIFILLPSSLRPPTLTGKNPYFRQKTDSIYNLVGVYNDCITKKENDIIDKVGEK